MLRDHIIQDKLLIKSIKSKNCSESTQELLNRHEKLMFSMYHKYSNYLSKLNYNLYDFKSDMNYILFNSINSYDMRRKTKFSSWLALQTRFYCLNKIHELYPDLKHESSSEEMVKLLENCASDSSQDHIDICEFIHSIIEQMNDKRIGIIFDMKYFNPPNNRCSWKDIAKQLNVTSQTVINLHNKAINLIQTKIKSKNLFDKI